MKVAALALMALIGTAPAFGGDLRVTRGSLDMNANTHIGTLELFGERRFSFRGDVYEFTGAFTAGGCNANPLSCVPGATIPTNAVWAGADLRGSATLDDSSYPDVGGAYSAAQMRVQFTGSVVLPSLGTGPTTVSAPFALVGSFRHPELETLVGAGNAVVFLSPSAIAPGAWHIDRVHYRFAAGLPPPWATVDVGAVGVPGAAGYVDGAFYVDGSGGDIWDSADAFRYVYQAVGGDATIVAHVVAQSATHAFAKAGIMLRERVEPGAAHVILDVKPDGGIELMARFAADENTSYVAGAMSSSSPWLKLVRVGTGFTGSYSVDGATWTEVGTVHLADAAPAFLAGLAVTSHDVEALNSTVFDNVVVTADVCAHNLIIDGGFEQSRPPALGPPGWASDDPFRQVPAKSETHQPHMGANNGACWSPEPLDCGMYQDLVAPTTGAYTLRLYATSDRDGGLVGVNVNGEGVAWRDVEASGFANYQPYSIPFQARAGDAVRVWMYSPAVPGYVVIDDVSVTLDEPIVVTDGSWEINVSGGGPFGSFTLTSKDVQVTGTYDSGSVEARSCSPCKPGDVVALRSFFENDVPQTTVSFARGSATVDGRAYPFIEFGGAVALNGALVVIPSPTGGSYPELVTVSAPFTISGDLKGFDVLLRRDPLMLFDLPLTGQGTATLELLAGPGTSGPVLTFHRLRYVFEPGK